MKRVIAVGLLFAVAALAGLVLRGQPPTVVTVAGLLLVAAYFAGVLLLVCGRHEPDPRIVALSSWLSYLPGGPTQEKFARSQLGVTQEVLRHMTPLEWRAFGDHCSAHLLCFIAAAVPASLLLIVLTFEVPSPPGLLLGLPVAALWGGVCVVQSGAEETDLRRLLSTTEWVRCRRLPSQSIELRPGIRPLAGALLLAAGLTYGAVGSELFVRWGLWGKAWADLSVPWGGEELFRLRPWGAFLVQVAAGGMGALVGLAVMPRRRWWGTDGAARSGEGPRLGQGLSNSGGRAG